MNKTDNGMSYALGFVLKLAEAGVTLDEAENFFYMKKAADDYLRARPRISRNSYERIYAKTRRRLAREDARAQRGSRSLMYQGLRNPVTGKFRVPFSFGSIRTNTDNSTMTPAQANMVALLTKHKNLKDFRDVARKSRKGSPDFEFLRDPTVFDSTKSRLTDRGRSDFRKAYKHVHGVDPDDFTINRISDKLFGGSAGFNGTPFTFRSAQRRSI